MAEANKIQKSDWQIVIKIPIQCFDAVDARMCAIQLIDKLGGKLLWKALNSVFKIQKLVEGKPPQGIDFDYLDRN